MIINIQEDILKLQAARLLHRILVDKTTKRNIMLPVTGGCAMIPGTAKLPGTLSGNDVTFFIPPYQRNYEWDKEHCEVFFRDVVETAKKNIAGEETEHFFGSVTYFQDETPFGQPDKLVLIDGQQRITTTMLFLVAMRDLTEDEGTKIFIDNKFLRNNNVSDDTEYRPCRNFALRRE